MSLLTYLNPNAIKDASIEGIKLKDGAVSSSKIDGTVASKSYVDDTIASAISASDAMVFKGTLGTGGTSESLPSAAIVGDTYKVIALTTIPGASSYTGAEETAKVGDLIVAISAEPKWIVVPSGDEAIDALVQPITWGDLKAKRDVGGLIPGMQYRITDYTCTTVTSGTRSAGHQFDIIVRADSENKLNEEASAIQHEGDTYFTNNNLSAWKIWYSLDNDTTRFAWADSTNGKGVIYRMIDEWNNDVPYDFKNIMFKRYILDANNAIATNVAKDGELNAVKTRLGEMSHRIHTSLWYYGEYVTDVYPNAEAGRKYVPFGDVFYYGDGPGVLCPINEANSNWFYTFSDTSFNDNTLTGQGNVHDNVVKGNKYALFTIDGEGRYSFEEQENICLNDIIFIRNICYSNSFGNNCFYNSFGNNCYYNSFGNGCYNNSFGNGCISNSFGNDCNSNSFGNGCKSNFFWNDCFYNSFGNDCFYNSFGNNCYSNSFGNGCNSNSFENYCYSNSFGNDCNYNSFGNVCYSNSFGNDCYYNTFGNDCNYIKFASDESALTKYNFYQSNHFGDGCQFILFKGAETASFSAQVQNYNFAQGPQGTHTTYLTVDGVRNRAFETKVAQNSNGELKIYCEADLIK